MRGRILFDRPTRDNGHTKKYPTTATEITLIETGILMARFDELNGVILEVEVDLDVSDTVLLAARFRHGLLEVGVEAEHLLVESHPRRQVEAVPGWDGAVRSRHLLTRKSLAADARLRLADHQRHVFSHVEMMRLVKLGLSHLYTPYVGLRLQGYCSLQGGPKKRGHSTFSQISRKLLKISK